MRGDDLGGQLLHCMSHDTSFRRHSFERGCCVQVAFSNPSLHSGPRTRLIALLYQSALTTRLRHSDDRARVVSPQVFDARRERRFSCTRSMELVGSAVASRFTFTMRRRGSRSRVNPSLVHGPSWRWAWLVANWDGPCRVAASSVRPTPNGSDGPGLGRDPARDGTCRRIARRGGVCVFVRPSPVQAIAVATDIVCDPSSVQKFDSGQDVF